MTSSKHIIVVDDCELIRDTVCSYLEREAYRVSVAEDGQSLRKIIDQGPVDLAIVDLNLPDEDGFSLTRFLRERVNCGIIMLTSKADTTDRVVALEIGADDYITKPYDSRELLARVRSVLRRLSAAAAPAANESNAIDFGAWQFDVDARCVFSGVDRTDLTTAEYNLLKELVARGGQILTREHLLNVVYDRPWDYFDRSIDVLVTRLRRKLDTVTRGTNVIKSVRGSGYVFSEKRVKSAAAG
jgi:two-component system torCAD operon response regulator TorR